jgi:hypothetical protein
MRVWRRYEELEKKYYDICNTFCLLFRLDRNFFYISEMQRMISELLSEFQTLENSIDSLGKLDDNDEKKKADSTTRICSHLQIKLKNIHKHSHVLESKRESNILRESQPAESNAEPSINRLSLGRFR